MANTLTEQQINDLNKRLRNDFMKLREVIRQELLNSDNEQYNELAGQVHDVVDESIADLLVDVNLAVIDQHVREVEDIEAALIRVSRGEYGSCIDCGDTIPYERLQVYPVAKRCRICQTRYEQTHVQKGRPTL